MMPLEIARSREGKMTTNLPSWKLKREFQSHSISFFLFDFFVFAANIIYDTAGEPLSDHSVRPFDSLD